MVNIPTVRQLKVMVMRVKSLIFELNEYYNRNLEQKIAGSIFAGGV